MGLGPGRFLAVGLGAHAAGRASGNAAMSGYVEQVHIQVRRDVEALSDNLALQVISPPRPPAIRRQPSAFSCCLRGWFLTGLGAWLLFSLLLAMMAWRLPANQGHSVVSILLGASLIAVVPAVICSVVIGLPIGLGTYASRARAYSRFQGATLVQRYLLERERVRRDVASRKMDEMTAATVLSQWPRGVETYGVLS